MPLVRIETWPIPAEKKQALIAMVTQAVVDAVGCPDQAVEIMLFEVEKANWAQGGVCHADRSPHTQ
ncbi:MAG TPA: tautomerase family protein [Coriobacteriia bacterium]